MFRAHVPIVRRAKLYYTVSGIITPIGGRPVQENSYGFLSAERKTPKKGFFSPMTQQPIVGQGSLIVEASRSHSDTPHSVGFLWTGDQPDAETST